VKHIDVMVHKPFFLCVMSSWYSVTCKGSAFLGPFTKLCKATVSFIMSICPFARNKSAPTGCIVMKFDIEYFSKIFQGNSSFIKT